MSSERAISPLAGRPPPRELLIDPAKLERDYYERRPDVADPSQRVSFATSGHRGSSLNGTFSREQYVGAAEAFLRGIERRVEAGLKPGVGSVASVFVSRWDAAVKDRVAPELNNRLGIAVAEQIYQAYRELLDSPRWQRAYNVGARPQRLLFASTGTKDPHASDVLYVRSLGAPFTVNTMPEATLLAFGDHGALAAPPAADGGDSQDVLARFASAGIDTHALAQQLQDEGAKSFVKSWNELMDVIASKSASLRKAG